MATFHVFGIPVTIGFDDDLVEKTERYYELYEETLGADDGEPVDDWDEYNRKDQERVDLWHELRKEDVDFGSQMTPGLKPRGLSLPLHASRIIPQMLPDETIGCLTGQPSTSVV